MANGGDPGFFLGMMARRRVQERRAAGDNGQQKGGGTLFNIFPKMVIPMIIYAIIAYITTATGGTEAFVGNAETAGMLRENLFTIDMVRGGKWGLSTGDLLLLIGLVFLFIEMVKAAGSGTATIMNHALSMLVFVIALAMFLLLPLFATSTFFLLMMMALLDTLAGFVITIVAARRDLAVAG